MKSSLALESLRAAKNALHMLKSNSALLSAQSSFARLSLLHACLCQLERVFILVEQGASQQAFKLIQQRFNDGPVQAALQSLDKTAPSGAEPAAAAAAEGLIASSATSNSKHWSKVDITELGHVITELEQFVLEQLSDQLEY
ncbi:hypothetical protein [Agaribacterium haliotis]|uniref:hypothetical protein n=1 Tax=Agaribacterium haliotis TaxID=2013869 RepID=UPI000BB5856E|nr:hypothetical protein [Agaribacterium haliotis]